MSLIEENKISAGAPFPNLWPGEHGFFYAKPSAAIGEVLQAYSFTGSPKRSGGAFLSLLLGAGGGVLLVLLFARPLRDALGPANADFGVMGLLVLGGLAIAAATFFALGRISPLSAEAIFVGKEGVAYHTISFGKGTERVVRYKSAPPPQRLEETWHRKGGSTVWPLLRWTDGGKPFDVRVEVLLPIIELAYADATTPHH